MHFSSIAIVAFATFVPFTEAHGIAIPHVVGLDLASPKGRDLLQALEARFLGTVAHSESALETRQSKPECGEGIGSCPAGKCCSKAGCR